MDCLSETVKKRSLGVVLPEVEAKGTPSLHVYCTKDAIKQSDSYGWIWTSGLTSTALLRCVRCVASGNRVFFFFSTRLCKDTWQQLRTHQRVYVGKY